MNKVDTLIIGGGISGLSAAHFLSKRKIDFILLESSNRLGGVIKSQTRIILCLKMDQIQCSTIIYQFKKLINDCNLK